jgi:phosphoglycerate dehydrogenase-like enzyme
MSAKPAGPAADSKVVLFPEMLDPVGEEVLRSSCQQVTTAYTDAEAAAALANADAVIVRGPAYLSGELMDKAKQLRVISVSGAGYDCVDIDAATQRGLPVIYLPGFSALPVAEYVIGGLIICARRIGTADKDSRSPEFDWSRRSTDLSGTLIAGAQLGLVGLGNVGRTVARLASALGMKVVGYDPFVKDWPANVKRLDDVDEALTTSDFISLNLPLTEESRGMLTRERIRSMKSGACIVNAARGEVTDEQALADALADGHLAFGVFDVFESEPEVWKSPLATAPNCVLTPHTAGVTKTTIHDTVREVAHGVVRALNAEFEESRLVNPDAVVAR